MTKRDFFLITLSLFLVGGIWYVATHDEKVKNFVSKSNQTPPTPSLSVPYFSDQIQIFSPQPDELIKGTIFKITGKTKINSGSITIKLIDKESKSIQSELVELSAGDEQNWKSFNQEFNVAPYDGMLKIEILAGSTQEKLAQWLIRVIRSI